MAKFRVLLHGRDLTLDVDGERQRGGFYIHCCVAAPDEAVAGERALAELRRHLRYQALLAGKLSEPAQPEPVVLIDEVERLPWWDRHPLGIAMGFTFYSDPDQVPLQ